MGSIANLFNRSLMRYMDYRVQNKVGGGVIQYPYTLYGEDNFVFSNDVNIGKGSIIMSTRAKVIIKSHFVAGPNLTIITGDHMPIKGRYLDSISDYEKDLFDVNHIFDQDVLIHEDVWVGANVTILKGVTIGRGCIIAAGAIVTKDLPPYTICGGIPAKVIKMRYTIDEIMEHEKQLYSIEERLSEESLNNMLS